MSTFLVLFVYILGAKWVRVKYIVKVFLLNLSLIDLS